jgi:HSP20 family protein
MKHAWMISKGAIMKIIRYHNSPVFSPSVNYPSLREEMDRLFDVAFTAPSSLQNSRFFGDLDIQFPVDLYQTKDAFIVRAELPGFRKEEVGVEVTEGLLTITANEKVAEKAEGRNEQANGAVPERRGSRALSLPENVDAEKIKAQYENGVLTLTLPKREEVKPRQIVIDVK